MDNRSNVLLTRRRWNIYMAPLFGASMLIGAYCFWRTGELRFALAPVIPLFLWAMLLWLTPRGGFAYPTIRSSPGAKIMLGSLVFAVFTLVAAVAVDGYLLGHPVHASLEPYHLLLFAPTFLVIFAGAYLADHAATTRNP